MLHSIWVEKRKETNASPMQKEFTKLLNQGYDPGCPKTHGRDINNSQTVVAIYFSSSRTLCWMSFLLCVTGYNNNIHTLVDALARIATSSDKEPPFLQSRKESGRLPQQLTTCQHMYKHTYIIHNDASQCCTLRWTFACVWASLKIFLPQYLQALVADSILIGYPSVIL